MLYCVQAAVVSAEQQVSSLEAALQQGSQMTLSMTEKVAQTLAASNTQAETFKVRAGFSPLPTTESLEQTECPQRDAASCKCDSQGMPQGDNKQCNRGVRDTVTSREGSRGPC
jgi:hypothetical protein